MNNEGACFCAAFGKNYDNFGSDLIGRKFAFDYENKLGERAAFIIGTITGIEVWASLRQRGLHVFVSVRRFWYHRLNYIEFEEDTRTWRLDVQDVKNSQMRNLLGKFTLL